MCLALRSPTREIFSDSRARFHCIQRLKGHKLRKSDKAAALDKFQRAVYRYVDHACRRAEIASWHRRRAASGMGAFPFDPRPSLVDRPPSHPSDDKDPPELSTGTDKSGRGATGNFQRTRSESPGFENII